MAIDLLTPEEFQVSEGYEHRFYAILAELATKMSQSLDPNPPAPPEPESTLQPMSNEESLAFEKKFTFWFGEHDDKPLRDVPLSYLVWFTESGETERVKAAKKQLRRYLASERIQREM